MRVQSKESGVLKIGAHAMTAGPGDTVIAAQQRQRVGFGQRSPNRSGQRSHRIGGRDIGQGQIAAIAGGNAVEITITL